VTTFDYLTVNNPVGISVGDNRVPTGILLKGGEDVVDSVTVSQTLTFIAGNIRFGPYSSTDMNPRLLISGSVSGASTTRHIVAGDVGRVMRSIAGGGSFQFPVGPTDGSYNPLTIALDPADTTETFSVRVYGGVSPAPRTIHSVCK
jgi:hypothetical protein